MKATDPPVVVSETFDASAETIWQALTQPELMRLWYFDNIPDFKPVPGFETSFNIHNDGRDFLHQWRVTAVEINRKIAYGWKYQQYSGRATVSFDLEPENGQTRLTVTCDIHEDFDDTVPEFTAEACRGGWEYFIKQRLKDYLSGVS